MSAADYSRWSCDRSAERALQHADRSGATQDNGGAVWNFAFGSNLNVGRVRRRGIVPLVAPLRGRLPGWCLVFNHIGGYGNIEKVPNALDMSALPQRLPSSGVHGTLLLFSRAHFAELARQEYAYDTEEVEVEIYESALDPAYTSWLNAIQPARS